MRGQTLIMPDTLLANVFTPNNDGLNDKIDFYYVNLAETYISIFDRWGTEVFKSDQYHTSWDGKNEKGIDCSPGVYFYTLQSTGVVNKTYDVKGFIQLLR